jgi:hypothetical protein
VIEDVAVIFAVVSVASPPTGRTPLNVFDMGIATTGAVPKRVAPAKNDTVPVGAFPKLFVLTVATSVKFVFASTFGGNVVIDERVVACVIVNGTPTDVLAL